MLNNVRVRKRISTAKVKTVNTAIISVCFYNCPVSYHFVISRSDAVVFVINPVTRRDGLRRTQNRSQQIVRIEKICGSRRGLH